MFYASFTKLIYGNKINPQRLPSVVEGDVK